MVIAEDVHHEIDVVISVVARRLLGKHHSEDDPQDLAQELWAWLLKKPRRLEGVVETVDEPDDHKRELAYLEHNLTRAGDVIVRKEKAARGGYRTSDEYFYSVTLVEALLEAHSNDGVLAREGNEYREKRTRTLSSGMDVECMLADLRSALDVLDPVDRELVVGLHGGGCTAKVLASDYDVSRQAIEQRAERVVTRMIEHLGGGSPYR